MTNLDGAALWKNALRKRMEFYAETRGPHSLLHVRNDEQATTATDTPEVDKESGEPK